MRQRWKAIRTGARLALACLIVAAAAFVAPVVWAADMEDVSVLTPSAGENLEASAILTTGASAEPVQGAAHDERLEGNTLAGAQPQAAPPTPSSSQPLYVHRPSYREYLDAHQGAPSPDVEIVIPSVAYSDKSPDMEVQRLANAYGRPGAALWTGERGWIEWKVDVPEAGWYNIEVEYYPAPGRGTPIEREIQINGEILFSGAELLVFHRIYGDEGPFLRDVAGNEIRPRQVEKPVWRTVYLTDSLGYVREPYQFYLRQGENTLRLISRTEPMVLGEIRVKQAPRPLPYAEVKRAYEAAGYRPTSGHMIFVQGEHAALRSSPALFAVFDQGDPTTEPYHPAEIRLNSIGGHRWQVLGDWIAWEVEVPEDGLYEIAIKAKQNLNRGTFSNRRILIDGQVPFAELEAVPFNYSSRYQMKRLGLDFGDEPFLFYLTKGKHEIRMEVVLGDLAELVQLSEEVLYELNSIYRSIIMITSATPDPMRSYQLERRVPRLLERLAQQSAVIKEMAAELQRITGERGGHTATLIDLARMLDRMVDRPDSIPNLLREYRDGIGNLGTWIMNTRNQPLQIDYLIVASPGEELPRARPTIWETMLHEMRAFIASFFHDYTGILEIADESQVTSRAARRRAAADADDPNSIKVWIGIGRDQAQILKQMIEDTFTPETGIRVNLELVNEMQRLLVPASIAGTQPDVAIGVADMDLAFRGAVLDLATFPDFPEVAKRFKKSALLPFTFREHVFALPDIQSFPMLFYRKDILADLGLEVPQTWDDVFRILPELQNHHLEFGLTPSIYTYLQFLYQKGVSLYKEDGVAVNLDSEAAIQTFIEMTNLYTQSGLPLEFNFINRFRMGEMPLGISNYGDYNTLSVFAPELRGQWGMAPIPGVRMPDGTINRTAPVAHNVMVGTELTPQGTTGSIIMAKSRKKEQAWEFLKWWTRTDTQVRFGREMEALLGAAARYATANVEAMQQLPWRVEEREALLEQWNWVEGIPPVVGAYYVTRQFDWLFRAVVLQHEPVRESVLDYTREINRELTRKREELGFETDPEKLDPRWRELFWQHYTHIWRLDVEPEPPPREYLDILAAVGLETASAGEAQSQDRPAATP
jgi:ABC-type sugar transport system, periplasmic component